MKKVLMMLLGLVTAAICMAASSSALADTPCGAVIENSNKYCLHYELAEGAKELELISTGEFLLTQENAVTHELEIKTATATKIVCSSGVGTANTESNGAGSTLIMKATIVFTGCEITSANKAECEVDKEIKAAEIDGTSSLQEEEESSGTKVKRVDTLLSSENAETGTFATFTIKSKAEHTCTQAQSKGKVRGEQLCFWLDNAEEPLSEDRETHLLQCVESELTFAGTASPLHAEFEAKLLKANGVAAEGLKWAIIETEF